MKPDTVMGVTGCMAQRLGPQLLEKAKHVSLVIGPDGYRALPQLVEGARRGERSIDDRLRPRGALRGLHAAPLRQGEGVDPRAARLRLSLHVLHRPDHARRRSAAAGSTTWCARRASVVADGMSEVVLLGPDGELVHRRHARLRRPAARRRHGARHPARALHEPAPERLQRSRDRGDGRGADGVRARAPADAERLDAHAQAHAAPLHARGLPRLRRDASARAIPGLALTTDIIVGFPGETDEEFEETLSAVREVGFDDAFTFKFSPRDGTPATRMPAELDASPTRWRASGCSGCRRRCARSRARAEHGLLGTRHEVLVEKEAKRGEAHAAGAHARLQDGARARRRGDARPVPHRGAHRHDRLDVHGQPSCASASRCRWPAEARPRSARRRDAAVRSFAERERRRVRIPSRCHSSLRRRMPLVALGGARLRATVLAGALSRRLAVRRCAPSLALGRRAVRRGDRRSPDRCRRARRSSRAGAMRPRQRSAADRGAARVAARDVAGRAVLAATAPRPAPSCAATLHARGCCLVPATLLVAEGRAQRRATWPPCVAARPPTPAACVVQARPAGRASRRPRSLRRRARACRRAHRPPVRRRRPARPRARDRRHVGDPGGAARPVRARGARAHAQRVRAARRHHRAGARAAGRRAARAADGRAHRDAGRRSRCTWRASARRRPRCAPP